MKSRQAMQLLFQQLAWLGIILLLGASGLFLFGMAMTGLFVGHFFLLYAAMA